MRCKVEKADILPIPTLAYDESTISGTLNILRTVTQVLGLTEDVVRDKVIMLKGDLLTVRNVTRAIFRRQDEPTKLHR